MIQFIALNHDIKYASDPGCKSKGDGFVGGTVGLKSSIQETTASRVPIDRIYNPINPTPAQYETLQ